MFGKLDQGAMLSDQKPNQQQKQKRPAMANAIGKLVGGAGSRHEYSILGDKTNLAARLMGGEREHPRQGGGPELQHLVRWESIGTTIVKDKSEPIAWQVDKAAKQHQPGGDKHNKYMSECSKMIEELHATSHGKVVFVEGEVGLGKAALIRRVTDQTANRVWWLWGKGSWVHETRKATLLADHFRVWKQLLLALCRRFPFPFHSDRNRASLASHVRRRRPDLEAWLFLLSRFDLVPFLSEAEEAQVLAQQGAE